MGLVAGGLAAGSALYNMFQGAPAQNVQMPSPASFQLPNMTEAAGGAMAGIQNLAPYTAAASSALPMVQTAATSLYNNPYSGGYLQGLQGAQGLGYGSAGAIGGLGANVAGVGGNLIPLANQIAMSGFDPQQLLYNRLLQQTQDLSNVTNAQYGLSGSPYGAGVANQALSNFNIDWQNQQLQRQLQAGAGAGSLYGQYGNMANIGAGLMGQAPGLYAQAAGYPFEGYGNVGNQQLGALGSLYGLIGQGQGIGNVPVQDYMSYLSAGQQGQQMGLNATQLALQQAGMGFKEESSFFTGRKVASDKTPALTAVS